MEAQFISPIVEILYKLETMGLCYFSSAKGDWFSSSLNGYIQLYNSFPRHSGEKNILPKKTGSTSWSFMVSRSHMSSHHMELHMASSNN